MATISRGISKGQLVPFVFGLANVGATQTDVQLVAADPSGNTEYAAAFPGEILGIAWNVSAAVTAGALAIGATINGTEDADTTVDVPADSATLSGSRGMLRGATRFSAGDRLGVEITTDGEFLPTTTDLTVTLYVLQNLEGI